MPAVPKSRSHPMMSFRPSSFHHLLKLCQSVLFFLLWQNTGPCDLEGPWDLEDSWSLPKPMQSARGQIMACLSQWKILDVCS